MGFTSGHSMKWLFLSPFFWVELEFRVLVLMEEENGEPEEKPLEQR